MTKTYIFSSGKEIIVNMLLLRANEETYQPVPWGDDHIIINTCHYRDDENEKISQ